MGFLTKVMKKVVSHGAKQAQRGKSGLTTKVFATAGRKAKSLKRR